MSTHNFSGYKEKYNRMSLTLFNAGRDIETLFVGSQPCFKRADLGRYLNLVNIKDTYRKIPTKSRETLALEGGASDAPLVQGQNGHDAFISLDGAIEVVVRS
jgi:hypothetical protein